MSLISLYVMLSIDSVSVVFRSGTYCFDRIIKLICFIIYLEYVVIHLIRFIVYSFFCKICVCKEQK